MDTRLTLIIFLVVVGATLEVYPQRSSNPIGIKRFTWSTSNDIDAGEIYQRISAKKQSENSWINSREIYKHKDDELLKILLNNSASIDFTKLDAIGDQVISRANVSEETKRVARQVKKTRPGFFWTIFRVAFETINETRSAIQQINEILDANILPDTTTTIRAPLKATTKIMISTNTVTTSSDKNDEMTTTTSPTTKAPYKLTRSALQNIVRRNLQGLVRLFNIEWKDAVDQSQISIRQFQEQLGKSALPFLADNPAAY